MEEGASVDEAVELAVLPTGVNARRVGRHSDLAYEHHKAQGGQGHEHQEQG